MVQSGTVGISFVAGAVIGGLAGGVWAGIGLGLLCAVVSSLVGSAGSSADAQSNSSEPRETDKSLQELVDEVNDGGVDGALARNTKARELEREARKKRKEEDEEGAEVLIEEAKSLYLENVSKGFVGTAPYKRLAIIYRRESNYDSEIEISRKALEVAKLTDNQREHFEHRIERAKELSGS